MPGPEQSGGGSVASPVPATRAASQGATKSPRSRFQTFLHSGSKKHVFVGLVVISVVTCTPYFLLTSGSKHQNHADYMDAAEKARQSRLSSSSGSST